MFVRVLLLVVLLSVMAVVPSAGQGVANSLCAKYTAALNGGVDNGANEYSLIGAVVTLAAFGGTPSGQSVNVQGIVQKYPLPAGTVNPIYGYFDGSIIFKSNPTNYTVNPVYTSGQVSSFNNSNWGTLATHLVSYFGALLGCNINQANYGTSTGLSVNNANMYSVHQGMGITQAQMTYFDNAVVNAMLALGVTQADVNTLAAPAFAVYFQRCSPPVQGNSYISSSTSGGLTQICGTATCTNSTQPQCNLYPQQSGAAATSSLSVVVGLSAAAFAIASLLL